MQAELYSWGAAEEVTGSKHFLKIDDQIIQIDCGAFQGRRKESEEKNREWPFNAEEVTGRDFSLLLLYMGLLKKSRYVRNHKWYDLALSFLSRFIGGDGVPLFPSAALPEKSGYWVSGLRMGLEPGRRTRKVLLKESAFRMLSYLT